MSKDAYNFMLETDRPHVNGEARAKILSLLQEIDKVYKTHMRRSTGKTCDICGKGDTDELHRVKDVVNGYSHREHESPVLCYPHACGWNKSFTSLELNRKGILLALNPKKLYDRLDIYRTAFEEPVLSNEETDLHFARFLANQLKKASNTKCLT